MIKSTFQQQYKNADGRYEVMVSAKIAFTITARDEGHVDELLKKSYAPDKVQVKLIKCDRMNVDDYDPEEADGLRAHIEKHRERMGDLYPYEVSAMLYVVASTPAPTAREAGRRLKRTVIQSVEVFRNADHKRIVTLVRVQGTDEWKDTNDT